MKILLQLSILFLGVMQIQAQGWGQTQKIVPSDRALGDFFGESVSMSGDYAVVGARFDDFTSSDMGSAYIYKNDGLGNWTEYQKLVAPDKRQFDQFGFAVAIDGDYLIVGAVGQDYDVSNSNFENAAGAAYIYEKDINDNWNFVQKIVASDRENLNQFGQTVDLKGNYAVVSPTRHDFDASGNNFVDDAGAVYIFERDESGVWNEVQKIVASERTAFDYFGRNGLAVDGNYIAAGAFGEDEDENGANSISATGAVYIFERNSNGTWNEIQKITASDRSLRAYFGWSVALNGNSLFVGANQDINSRGAAYIFEKDGNNIWNQVEKLTASNSLDGDQFGFDLDMDESRLIIGARYRDIGSPGDDGAAYIFEKQGGVWNETAFIYDAFNATSEYFGYSVALSGDYTFVGAYKDSEDDNEQNSLESAGAAFVFDVNEPYTLSVIEGSSSRTIKAFPNPTKHMLNIDLGAHQEVVTVTINNVLGQQVLSKNYTNSKTIQLDIQNQPKGMYLIEIKIVGKVTSVLKLVKH